MAIIITGIDFYISKLSDPIEFENKEDSEENK